MRDSRSQSGCAHPFSDAFWPFAVISQPTVLALAMVGQLRLF
jgi:hypothetical protein